MKIAALVVSLIVVALVLTNNVHHQVFVFDLANEQWDGEYQYNWGYVLATVWIVCLFMAFFALLFRVAHFRLKRRLALVVLFGLLILAYGVLYALRVGNLFSGNFSLTYIALIVVCLETMMRLGLLPSFSHYGQVFKELPFDVKVLSPDLKLVHATRHALPLTSEEVQVISQFAASSQDGLNFTIEEKPDNAYEVIRQRGSFALFTEDRSAVRVQRKRLEDASEALKVQIALLENSVSVQRGLFRLTKERELLDEVDEHLSSTVEVIRILLDDLPEEQAERARALNFVRLLIGYCKRMGSFVLADAGQAIFDNDHLVLVLGDTAADARASGISCASFSQMNVGLDRRSLMLLYSCMYDVLLIAYQFCDSAVIFTVGDGEEGSVVFRATLEVGSEREFTGSDVAESLRCSLSVYGLPHSLAFEENQLLLTVVLPAQGRGDRS